MSLGHDQAGLLQRTAQLWTVTLLRSSLVLLLDDGDPCWLPANGHVAILMQCISDLVKL